MKKISLAIILVAAVALIVSDQVSNGQTQTVHFDTVSEQHLKEAGVRFLLPEKSQANPPVSEAQALEIAAPHILDLEVRSVQVAVMDKTIPSTRRSGLVWVIETEPATALPKRNPVTGEVIQVERASLLAFVDARTGEFLSMLMNERPIN